MRKYCLYIVLFAVAIFNYSCNDSLNPDAPFRQRYALTGIMRSDTSYQVVTLTKSYMPSEGLNPLTNTNDPAIVGAEVNMWYRDTLYPLRDTTIARQDSSHYTDSVHFYYVKNLKPLPGEYIDIEALLPNGILLQSYTQMPAVPTYGFFDYNNDQVIPPENKDYISIKWLPLPNELYSPRIDIIYYKKNSSVKYEKEVPLYYTNVNRKSTPIYPKQTSTNYFVIDTQTISKTLNDIPQGDLNKKDYSIAEMDVNLIIYDEYLSTYYSSIQLGVNGYTVQLDKPDYSNIQGGYGIFGSYVRTSYTLKFTYSYLQSLGFY